MKKFIVAFLVGIILFVTCSFVPSILINKLTMEKAVIPMSDVINNASKAIDTLEKTERDKVLTAYSNSISHIGYTLRFALKSMLYLEAIILVAFIVFIVLSFKSKNTYMAVALIVNSITMVAASLYQIISYFSMF